MSYIDGFVIAIPKKNVASYKKMAEFGKKLWVKYGALDYYECLADDMHPKGVELTFPKLIKTKPNETVIFSFIIFKNKAHRAKVNRLVMKDPYMTDPKNKDIPMPFEMNRMAYGGFKTIVQK
ncbi:MAG: DUF1428 domain-containing protein [Candidatus Pacearchaeota archaeon]|jgi:alkaline phosphatase